MRRTLLSFPLVAAACKVSALSLPEIIPTSSLSDAIYLSQASKLERVMEESGLMFGAEWGRKRLRVLNCLRPLYRSVDRILPA